MGSEAEIERTVPASLAVAGLTSAQVAERARAGQVNERGRQPTRTVGQILRANILTRFNAVLGALFAVIAVVGPLQDGLFGLVLVANSAIGIFQELRAKRTLDRLTILSAPSARVLRDGAVRDIAAEQVVLDDVLDLQPGDQVVADGRVLSSAGLEVDESLLSGEADAVAKEAGDQMLSGSFVAAGSGRMVAVRVGAASYAARLAADARSYSPAKSEIRDAINRLLTWIGWALVPVGALLVASQLRSGQPTAEALRGSVAGMVGMVPEGLVLLTSVAMAVGVVRLAARRVLVQDLPAIEGLARVDVVCCDKTGTLTDGSMQVSSVTAVGRHAKRDVEMPGVDTVLGALAAADSRPNATMRAIAERFADPGWRPTQTTAFSSARKWSSASYEDHGTWLIGAPEPLLTRAAGHDGDGGHDGGHDGDGGNEGIAAQADDLAKAGYRVLLLARVLARATVPGDGRVPAQEAGPGDERRLLDAAEPVALIALAERVRPDAAATLAYFADQHVSVRVISGDHPATVGAIARGLGLLDAGQPRPGQPRPGQPRAGQPRVLDARELPDDADELADAVSEAAVIGRVTPHQKLAIITALQRRAHVVAMTGDGVNDVLALKNCDVGIAMGSGTPASRGVARLVLLDDAFATLPRVVAEGRRLIGNVDRVSRLFLTKTCYAAAIALVVAAARVPYPFYPRHLTIISTLSIGVPAFLLALAPNADRVAPGFLGRALRFAVPAGLVIAGATLGAFLTVRGLGLGLAMARTSATLVAIMLSLVVLAALARPLASWRGAMVLALAAAFAVLLAVPWSRAQLALIAPSAGVLALSLGIAAVGVGALLLAWPAARRITGRAGRRTPG